MKKRVWTVVTVLGILFLAGAAGLTLWNFNTDQAAAEESRSLLTELAEAALQ